MFFIHLSHEFVPNFVVTVFTCHACHSVSNKSSTTFVVTRVDIVSANKICELQFSVFCPLQIFALHKCPVAMCNVREVWPTEDGWRYIRNRSGKTWNRETGQF